MILTALTHAPLASLDEAYTLLEENDVYYPKLREKMRKWQEAFLTAGHEPIVEDEGALDFLAYNEVPHHNGPKCSSCHYHICWHCNDIDTISPCSHSQQGEVK